MDLENWMLGLVKGVIMCHIFLQMEIRKLANYHVVPTTIALGLGDGPQRLHASREDELGLRSRAVLDWRMFQKSPGFGTKSIKTI